MLRFERVLTFPAVKKMFSFVPTVNSREGRYEGQLVSKKGEIEQVGRIHFNMEDYVGGMSDFTGELMKVCVRCTGTEDEKRFFLKALVLCQSLHAGKITTKF